MHIKIKITNSDKIDQHWERNTKWVCTQSAQIRLVFEPTFGGQCNSNHMELGMVTFNRTSSHNLPQKHSHKAI
jgi:hypothetical protein